MRRQRTRDAVMMVPVRQDDGTRAVVETALREGRAVQLHTTPGGRQVWMVQTTDALPSGRVPRRIGGHHPAVVAGGVLAAGVAGAGLVWLVVTAVAWVVAHWAAIVGVLVVTGVVAGAASSTRSGSHCPGCRD